jgi:hypothetical protein
VDVGVEGFSSDASDYVADELPEWWVPDYWCTPKGMDLVENNGAWLVDSGIVSSDSHVELIADTYSHRNVDTAYRLSLGIQDELEEDSSTVTGLELIRTNSFIFRPDDDGTCGFVTDGIDEAIQERLDSLPRPDINFRHALRLLEEIAGTGEVGSLVQTVPLHPKFDYDDWNLTGAAALLQKFGEILFLARAGLDSQDFAPDASVEQVYELLQYHHWFRSVLNVDNNWSAMSGAAWAKVAMLVLSKGALFGAPPHRSSSSTVTIITGHDDDLNTFATALGVNWDLPEYQSHPEFVPTPPSSGFHLVRDTDTDEVEASFLYPVYHKQGLQGWETDFSGDLKRVPLIWKGNNSFKPRGQQSLVPSLADLESHFFSTLEKFPGAMDCYDATAAKLAAQTSEAVPLSAAGQTKVSSSSPVKNGGASSSAARFAVPLTVVVALLAAFVVARRVFRKGSPNANCPTKVDDDDSGNELV